VSIEDRPDIVADQFAGIRHDPPLYGFRPQALPVGMAANHAPVGSSGRLFRLVVANPTPFRVMAVSQPTDSTSIEFTCPTSPIRLKIPPLIPGVSSGLVSICQASIGQATL